LGAWLLLLLLRRPRLATALIATLIAATLVTALPTTQIAAPP
jgi:hypothetical protein